MAEQTVTTLPRGVARSPAARSIATRAAMVAGPRPGRFQWWQPGWPLTYLVTGYPLWWLLGVTQLFLLLSAVIMAVQLGRTHRVRVRAGFGTWLLFLAWVAVGVLTLQVDAPGAQPGASNGRYVTFAFRFCLYLAATVALLYVYNFRSRIPRMRILRAFGWFFVTVVGGGLLGATFPYLSFPSALELVLPHGISHVDFVHTLVHPRVAQVIDPAHPSGTPRTSAPFTYTNDWGLAFACLLPFFLISWFHRDAGWRRHAAPWILLVAVYPVVQSQNRGLWIALLVSGLVVIIRQAGYGSIKFAITALVGALVAVAVVLSTPLGSSIIQRLTTSGSEGGRATLGTETLRSVAEASPVVGLGTTRPVQGSFYSIAGGDSPNCVGCSPPPLGTQGHFWLVAFSTGYGGLALYLGFVLIQLFRHIRLRSPVGTLGVVVILVHLSTMLIYDTIGMALVIIFVAIGLLWSEQAERRDPRTGRLRPDHPLRAYTGLVRRRPAVVAVCAVLGLLGGLAFQHERGIEHEAVTSVVVPVDTSSPIAGGTGLTVDTLAQLIGSPAVDRAVRQAVGHRLYPGGSKLFVTAKRNSRVLEIHVVDRRAAVAVRASRLAGAALVSERGRLLRDERDDDVRTLERRRAAYVDAVATLDAMPRNDPRAKPLTSQRSRLISQIEQVDVNILRLRSTPTDPGQVLATPPAQGRTDSWLVAGSSGLILGVLLALLLIRSREAGGRRVEAGSGGFGDLPVLARLPGGAPEAAGAGAQVLTAVGAATVLSADDSPTGRRAATALDDALARHRGRAGRLPRRGGVVLVTGPRTTDRSLARVQDALDACTARIAGVVVLSDPPVRDGDGRRHRIRWHRTRLLRGKRS